MPEPKSVIGAFPRFCQLLALSSFAVAQPLLDLIRRHAEFLVVHRADRLDVAGLVLVLVLAPPLVLWAMQALVGRFNRRAGTVVHEGSLTLLLAATLVPVLDTAPACDGYLTLAASALTALAGLWIYRRSAAVRDNLALLALTVPVFVGLFAFSSAVGAAVAPAGTTQWDVVPERTPAPVVLVIFDELPLATLLDADGEIDNALFPAFARLAARSTWYQRVASVSGATLRAVPAILTGRFPDWDQKSVLDDHPVNIFTVLGPGHRTLVHESQTSLCPREYLVEPRSGPADRLAGLLDDVAILYRHVVYPESLRRDLPPIDNKWNDFAGGEKRRGDRSRHGQFRAWTDRIQRTDEPALAVIHSLLPHSPYRHYPDGKIYKWREGVDNLVDGAWIEDLLALRDAYRRHLIQTVSVDRLLGNLLDRLEEQGLLDEAMVVVTADHGVCFTPGQLNRKLSEDNAHDLMSVPLFVKYPGQREGRRDTRYVQTVDIFPTILATVGAPLPAGIDGFPLTEPGLPGRTTLKYLFQVARVTRSYPASRLGERHRTLQWKDSHFQGLDDVGGIYGIGGLPDWTGRPVTDLPMGEPVERVLSIDESERYVDIKPRLGFLPGEISGEIAAAPGGERTRLAVAVNGLLAGSNETYLDLDGDGRQNWAILVPASVFRKGSNTLEIFVVEDRESGKVFRPITAPRS